LTPIITHFKDEHRPPANEERASSGLYTDNACAEAGENGSVPIIVIMLGDDVIDVQDNKPQ
jgi:hypothetical protein